MIRALAATACLLSCGCAGTGEGLDPQGRPIRPDLAPPPDGEIDDGGANDPASFAALQAGIFSAICAVECHTGAAAPQSLRLDRGQSYKLLVDVKSNEVPEMKRVVPGNPDESYIISKLQPMDARRLGVRMPANGPPYLGDGQIEAVRTWIARGALP